MLREALAAVSVATLGLAACTTAPTPYQPATTSEHGYSELRIENNRYRISFKGNSSTSRDTAETYMLYRAAELTLQNGYDIFTVAHRETDEDVRLRGYGGYGGFYGYPYYGWGSMWGPYWGAMGGPGYTSTSTSYDARIEIQMGRGRPGDDPETFDAREVTQNLSAMITRTAVQQQ
jgi:hypothetical protein